MRTAPAHPDWYLSASAARRATVARFGTHEAAAPGDLRSRGLQGGTQGTRELTRPRLPVGAAPLPAQ